MDPKLPLVLVTGASGYAAAHVINTFNSNNIKVRGTVRSLKDEKPYEHLKKLSSGNDKYPLELVEADLLKDDGWEEAMRDCKYVVHIAAPFPASPPSNESDVWVPTVEGTERVLKACAAEAKRASTLKRVILLTTIAAVHGESTEVKGHKFNENDWTDVKSKFVGIVAKSKTTAEKNAWDFVKGLSEDERFEFVVINSAFGIGPVYNTNIRTGQELIYRIMDRYRMPLLPEIHCNLVDIRDVAEACLKALTVPEAAGERLMLAQDPIWVREIADVLYEEFSSQGYSISRTSAPYSVLWMASALDKELREALKLCNKEYQFDGSKARSILGYTNRNIKESILDAAYSYIEVGMIEKTKQYRGKSG